METSNSKSQIRIILVDLINNFLEIDLGYKLDKDDDPLRVILSESMQAMKFIILLESEFEVEYDDDDISLEFFSSVDHIVDLTYNLITSRQDE